ncbi:MAG: ParB/RepB/Spo0J family partition protein [Gemmataceae bacterium]
MSDLLKKANSNLDESMGVRSVDLRPTLTPVSDPKDVGRRPLRNIGRVDVNQVVPDPDQPRVEFTEEALDRLAASIRDKGQLTPIRVRWSAALGKWVIIAGERRWRATRRAGLEAIDCVFVEGELSRGELLSQQLIENLLREDLKPVEEAKAFRELLTLNDWTGKQLADALRVPPSKVTRSLALLDLPEDLQHRVELGELPARSAYEIAKLGDDETRRKLAEAVQGAGLTVEDTRKAVRTRKGKATPRDRGTREKYAAPGGVVVTVTAGRAVSSSEIEAALVHALGAVRKGLGGATGSPTGAENPVNTPGGFFSRE